MIKQLNKNDSLLSPFVAAKQWALNNIDPDELVLSETTGSEEPVALEFIDYSSGTPIVNRECNIALEQQSTDLAVPEEGASGSGTFYPETEEVNPKTSTYKRLLYNQIKGAFYNSYRNPTQIFGIDNIDFPLSKINRFLADEFVMFTIPRDIFGEKISEKSVTLYDNNFDDNLTVQDDGFGNLIATSNIFSKVQELRRFGNFTLSDYIYYYNNYSLTSSLSSSTNTLPSARGSMTPMILGDKIYLLGGWVNGGKGNNIYTASIDTPTKVGNSGFTLPITMSQMSLLIVSGTIYLYGGFDGSPSVVSNKIFTASVSNPLVWGDSGVTLPTGMADGQAKIIGDKIWIFWGRMNTGTPVVYSSASYTASTSNPLVFGLAGVTNTSTMASTVIRLGEKFYSYGGLTKGDPNLTPSQRILTASVNNPLVWGTGSTLTMPGGERPMFCIGEMMYSFGGFSGSSTLSNVVYAISASSPLTVVRTGLTIPNVNWYHAGIAATQSNGTPYVALYGGGTLDSSTPQNYIVTASVSMPQKETSTFDFSGNPYWNVLSGYSASTQSRMVCTGSIPSGSISLLVSSGSALLNWTNPFTGSEVIEGYIVQRSADGSSFNNIAQVPFGTTTYSDSNLTLRNSYYYRVYGYNPWGSSSFSNTGSFEFPTVLPSDYTPLLAWFRAEDLNYLDDNTNVSTGSRSWIAYNDSTLSASQATASLQPKYTNKKLLGFLNSSSVEFSGSASFGFILSRPMILNTGDYTVMILFKGDTSGIDSILMAQTSSGLNNQIRRTYGGANVISQYTPSTGDVLSNTFTSSFSQSCVCIWRRTSGTLEFFEGKYSRGTSSAFPGVIVNNIGYNAAGGATRGNIAEICIWTGSLSTSSITDLYDNYWKKKYLHGGLLP